MGENIGFCRRTTAQNCAYTPEITTKKSDSLPPRIKLFTFSTGFSTVFVKKKSSFPRCFPLFPPGFPQQKGAFPIHTVMQHAFCWKIMEQNISILPFIKKKVEGFSLLFTVSTGLQSYLFPHWNFGVPSFPHPAVPFVFLWKKRRKVQFSTNISAVVFFHAGC